MSDSWDDYADGWDSHPAVQAYAEQAFSALQAVQPLAGLKVFDFGCGTGLLSEKIARQAQQVVALDPATKMLAVLDAKQVGNIHTVASALTPELIAEHAWAGQFALVVASSALAFVDDYPQTLRLLRSLLQPGGYLVQWDWLQSDDGAGMGFTRAALNSAIPAAGFATPSLSTPFVLDGEQGALPVLMAVAVNP
ncbi:class I SAM-dependent DNA methyltransferase [Atopomonas hussainii]|uniref:class I SAM-dependent DNA methyltransferase n=1 Tax=Atopomonas hussainii TaxID=1429083 RepID=UPI0008FFEADF|nr:methyltransferase [Atopomonas hussainii]